MTQKVSCAWAIGAPWMPYGNIQPGRAGPASENKTREPGQPLTNIAMKLSRLSNQETELSLLIGRVEGTVGLPHDRLSYHAAWLHWTSWAASDPCAYEANKPKEQAKMTSIGPHDGKDIRDNDCPRHVPEFESIVATLRYPWSHLFFGTRVPADSGSVAWIIQPSLLSASCSNTKMALPSRLYTSAVGSGTHALMPWPAYHASIIKPCPRNSKWWILPRYMNEETMLRPPRDEGNSILSKLEDIPEDRAVAVFRPFCVSCTNRISVGINDHIDWRSKYNKWGHSLGLCRSVILNGSLQSSALVVSREPRIRKCILSRLKVSLEYEVYPR
jgi:hypothetical protein